MGYLQKGTIIWIADLEMADLLIAGFGDCFRFKHK
jgi:hypothetical protein